MSVYCTMSFSPSVWSSHCKVVGSIQTSCALSLTIEIKEHNSRSVYVSAFSASYNNSEYCS